MKKQFLLGLMAMLLPLGAWADDFVVDPVEDITYNGDDTEEPVLVVKVSGDDQALEKGKDYQVTYSVDGYPDEDEVRNVGTYTATITGIGSYTDYNGTVTFKVIKPTTPLVLNTLQNTITYGDQTAIEKPAYYVASGLLTGDTQAKVTITDLALERVDSQEPMTEVGSYSVTLTGGTTRNYYIGIGTSSTLKINAKSLKVTYNGLDGWVYGQAETKLEGISVTGGDGYVYEKDTDTAVGLKWEIEGGKANVKDAKDYTITASITSKNYTLENPTQTFTIDPKKLEVTVSDIEKTYGMKDPAFTSEEVTVNGWEYDDENSVTVTLTRENKGEDVGEYDIDGCEVSSNNYTVVYNQGTPATLTINAKSLADVDITITVAENDKVYQGQQDNFKLDAITVKYTGKEVESIQETLDGTTEYNFSINEVKNAGETVTVTVTPLSKNYTGTATTTFEIAKAPLDITIHNQSFKFDATQTAAEQLQPDEYTIENTQLKLGDSEEALGIKLYLDDDANEGSVGTYEKGIRFEATGKIADNYEFNPTYGTLTITGDDAIELDCSTDEVSKKVTAYNGQTVEKVTIKNLKNNFSGQLAADGKYDFITDHKLQATKWYTLVLPFDVEVADLSYQLGYAIVNVPNPDAEPTTGKIYYKLTMGLVPANTLMLFKVAKDTDCENKELVFENVTISAPGENYEWATDKAGHEYRGVYTYTELTEAYEYIYNSGQDGVTKASTVLSVKGHSAAAYPLSGYFIIDAPEAANVRIYVEEADGTVTALNAVTGEAVNTSAEGWYTIGGMKLDAQPTQKGIYIHNGKKVVIE